MSNDLYAQQRSCARKRRFFTKQEAKRVVKQKPQYGKPYLCQFCGSYHLGHRHGAEWEM